MWFILAVLALIGWGAEDIFIKTGTDSRDELSQYRLAALTGLVFFVAGLLVTPFSMGWVELFHTMVANPIMFLVPLLYGFMSMMSNIGYRYLEAGMIAPLENAGGAFSTILFLCWYFYIGKLDSVWEQITKFDMVGTIMIVVGIILLGIVEQEGTIFSHNKLGALAFLFPLLYCLIDTFDTVVCGVILSEDSGVEVSPYDYFLIYALCFAVEGLISWLYVRHKEGSEVSKFGNSYGQFLIAAVLEVGATFGYSIAMEIEPMYTAVIVAPYCIVTELGSYHYLKERFTKGQYLCIATVVVGILLMGFQELF